MTQQLTFDPTKATPINLDRQSFSTDDINLLRSMILNAYKGVKEIDDILLNLLGNRVNIKVILKTNYSNKLLENLVNRQLAIYDNPDSKSYFFNFDYLVKNFYTPNDTEVSIIK
ncbi:hypothetical protein HYW39_02270 [Candidatus Curtissbacteria bacterium]|nr:hypothetical protein [Candidatus Curtissbacteria bacterium]